MNELLEAIQRLRNAAEGDRPFFGGIVVGAVAGLKAGGAVAHVNHPWPVEDWEEEKDFDEDAWAFYADDAEDAITYATPGTQGIGA